MAWAADWTTGATASLQALDIETNREELLRPEGSPDNIPASHDVRALEQYINGIRQREAGKTTTIAGIIQEMPLKTHYYNIKPQILVLTGSNKAVDQLIITLLDIRTELKKVHPELKTWC